MKKTQIIKIVFLADLNQEDSDREIKKIFAEELDEKILPIGNKFIEEEEAEKGKVAIIASIHKDSL